MRSRRFFEAQLTPTTSGSPSRGAAWAKADEYLTYLMDSDTMLTLENTNDAIKCAENYMQRQDTDGNKRVAFSSAVDGITEGQTQKDGEKE
jgi:hypothetical protein